jgi:hypothetical protein
MRLQSVACSESVLQSKREPMYFSPRQHCLMLLAITSTGRLLPCSEGSRRYFITAAP